MKGCILGGAPRGRKALWTGNYGVASRTEGRKGGWGVAFPTLHLTVLHFLLFVLSRPVRRFRARRTRRAGRLPSKRKKKCFAGEFLSTIHTLLIKSDYERVICAQLKTAMLIPHRERFVSYCRLISGEISAHREFLISFLSFLSQLTLE